jgi:hypothetical protein
VRARQGAFELFCVAFLTFKKNQPPNANQFANIASFGDDVPEGGPWMTRIFPARLEGFAGIFVRSAVLSTLFIL